MSDHTISFLEIVDQMLPDLQAEVDWTSGVNGLPSLTKRLLLVGPTDNFSGEIKRITSLAQAVTLYGEGSPMAGMVQAAFTESSKIELYAMGIAPGATTATLNATFVGTSTSAGVLKIWAAGRYFEVPIATGRTETQVVSDVVAKIAKDKYNLPVGVIAGVAGISQWDSVEPGKACNTIRIRIDTSDLPGIKINVGAGAVDIGDAPLAGGTTDTSPATILANIQGDQRFHLVAIGVEDTAAITALTTHMELMEGVGYQKWGIGIAATVGGSSGAQSIADTEDTKRNQIFSLPTSPRPVWEVAASFAAARAARDPRQELDDVELKWLMPPFDTTTWPTDAELESDLDEGVTPAKFVRQGNKVLVTRSIHTEHAAGVAIQKAWDTSIVEKADYFRESLLAAFAKYKGKTLKTASPAGRPSTITPKKAVAVMVGVALRLDRADFLQGVKTDNKAGLFIAQANDNNPDRLDLGAPYRPTRSNHFTAMQIVYTY